MKKLTLLLITPVLLASHHKANFGASMQASASEDNVDAGVGLYFKTKSPWVLGKYPVEVADIYSLTVATDGVSIGKAFGFGTTDKKANFYIGLHNRTNGNAPVIVDKLLEVGVGYEQSIEAVKGLSVALKASIQSGHTHATTNDGIYYSAQTQEAKLSLITSIDLLSEE